MYTIPLRDARKARRNKKSGKALKIVKEFIRNHLGADEVKIDSSLNQEIWNRGVSNPPARVRVRASLRPDGVVEVSSLE